MSNFDIIEDEEGKEYLIFDRSELYDDSQIGDKFEHFEILKRLGGGAFGEVFKVRSKKNNKVYALKKVDLLTLKKKQGQKALDLTMNETKFLEKLSHPHIIKYYKKFIEGEYLYIIIEFVENGDLEGFMEAHKIFNKKIEEEEIWNIFLQCMEALAYVHSMGVIHRDIKPANLLLDNNMIVKLGDFGVSTVKTDKSQYSDATYDMFEGDEKMQYGGTCVGTKEYMAKEVKLSDYDQKADVYSMGISFFELCYFDKPKNDKNEIKGLYSDELYNIIMLMMEENKEKRQNSQYFLKMIKDEYSKKYMKNTSIDSVIRCLYSLDSLTNFFIQSNDNNVKNKPITQAYAECLQYISKNGLKSEISPIKNIRHILGTENSNIQGTKEVDPRYLFAFLIKEFHKELNQPPEKKPDKNLFLIYSGDKESRIVKEEVMISFLNNISNKMNSFISNNFRGLIKLTDFCKSCNLRTFSFTNFFFITLNLEKMKKKLKKVYQSFKSLDLKKAIYFLNDTRKKKKGIYCNKCLKDTQHEYYKNFYSFPNLLVFSIQRGIKYEFKLPVDITEELDLTEDVEFKYSKKKFNLVGFLGRIDNNGNENFFSVAKFKDSWILCEGNKINEIKSPKDYNLEGDIIMLFYQVE